MKVVEFKLQSKLEPGCVRYGEEANNSGCSIKPNNSESSIRRSSQFFRLHICSRDTRLVSGFRRLGPATDYAYISGFTFSEVFE